MVGSHQHVLLGIVFAGAALGGELLKPFAVSEAIDSFGSWKLVRGLACLLLAFVCIVYSFTAELGLAAGSRSDLAASRAAGAEVARSASAERQRAETELAALPVTAPAAKLQADIDALLLRPGTNGCEKIDGRVTKEVCPQVAELRSQKAVAERRDQLELAISRSTTAPSGPVQVQADPLAGAVAVYANAAGLSWTAEAVLPGLALIPVLFLELGSALAVVVVRGVGGPEQPMPVIADAPLVPNVVAKSVQGKPAEPVRSRDGRPPDAPGPAPRALGPMAKRHRQQGKSERQIAKLLGTSKTTIHRALKAFDVGFDALPA